MVQISVPGFVAPKVVYSYFVYFTTTNRNEAFELPFPMWWVDWSPLFKNLLCRLFKFHYLLQVSIQLEKSNWLLPCGNCTISVDFKCTSVFNVLGMYGIWFIYVCKISDAGCSKCFRHNRGKYRDDKFTIEDFHAHCRWHFCACIWKRVKFDSKSYTKKITRKMENKSIN